MQDVSDKHWCKVWEMSTRKPRAQQTTVALRVEVHHDWSVQRSWQVGGHAEQDGRLAGSWNRAHICL